MQDSLKEISRIENFKHNFINFGVSPPDPSKMIHIYFSLLNVLTLTVHMILDLIVVYAS